MNLQVQVQGRFPRCIGVRTVVLHDHGGRIHHVHQALIFESARRVPDAAALEAVARRGANRRRPLPEGLVALHLEGAFPGPGPHRVDVARGVLIPGA